MHFKPQRRTATADGFGEGADRDPQLILADEPVSNLDPAASKQIMDLLAEFNSKEGAVAVCNLHLPFLREGVWTAYCPLSRGRVVCGGPVKDLSENQINSF